jgi:probable F420-dependent oxidoreductase
MRPFRFLTAVQAVVDGAALARTARRVESVGYSGLVVPDHLLDQLSPVPALATVAAATSRLRIASFMLNNDLRHPAVLAQDLASLDVLSRGRLEIGIGAGWNEPEYRAVGIAFEPHATRMGRLEESVRVLKAAFAQGSFTFHGDHYRITDHDGRPKPVQAPHPPLMIGGGGRRILELAGREADIVSLAPRTLSQQRRDPRTLTIASTEEKLAWVRAAAGDRFEQLELNAYPSGWPVVVTDDARAEVRRLRDHLLQRTGIEVDEDDLRASPHVMIGSLDALERKFRELRERLGISSYMVGEPGPIDALVERLAGT